MVSSSRKSFSVWVAGCPHTQADKDNGRNSITDAISHIDGTGAKCSRVNMGIILGDFSSNQNPTEIASYATEGADSSAQLNTGTKGLSRNNIYTLRGNHDPGDNNNDWYDRYIDRDGVNTAYSGVTNSLRPYPITGTSDYYSITTGNIVWLFLDDINHGAGPCGRSGASGGFPSGSTSLAAYNWWVSMIESNPGKIIITCAHHLLKNTTIATGDNEGVDGGYHGSSGQAVGSGRLHNVITDFALNIYEADQTRFMDYLTSHPGACVIWFGAHTHYEVGEVYATRGYMTTVNGCNFINVGGLTKYHVVKHPQSKVIQFTQGSNICIMNNMLHDTSFAPVGYYGNSVQITLPYAYMP
jgi:hypothetical protein